MGVWKLMAEGAEPGTDNSVWYARRGYVGYKEEVRYHATLLDGREVGLFALFMRKKLEAPSVDALVG